MERAGGRDQEHLAPFAVAAYKVTQAEVAVALKEVKEGKREMTPEHMPFISFPWLLHEVLGKIATAATQLGTAPQETMSLIDGVMVPVSTGPTFDDEGNAVLEVPNKTGQGPILNTDWMGQYFSDPFQPEKENVDNSTSEAKEVMSNHVFDTTSTKRDTPTLALAIPPTAVVHPPSQIESTRIKPTGWVDEDGVWRSANRRGSAQSGSSRADRKNSSQESPTISSDLPSIEEGMHGSATFIDSDLLQEVGNAAAEQDIDAAFHGDPADLSVEDLEKLMQQMGMDSD